MADNKQNNKQMKYLITFLASFLMILSASANQSPQFSNAGFYSLKGSGRKVFSMNLAWRFIKTDVIGAESTNFDDSKWEVVSLPHGLEYLPVDASGGVNYQGSAWYRKHFTPNATLQSKKLFLNIEAIKSK